MERLSRRSLLKAIGTATAVAASACERRNEESAGARHAYVFFTADDAAFVEAAVARLIPADDAGPGALDAGVPIYIDRQLAGAWGAGEQLYRSGPWVTTAAPEMGYQLPFTPAELFRKALRALTNEFRTSDRRHLGSLPPDGQDAYLRALETQPRNLDGVPSDIFFESLLELTIEGFFSDPAYGGNRDMIGWRLVGFPGAYANYYDLVDQYGIAFNRPPMSLAQDSRGVVHLHPVSPQGS